MRQFVLLWLWLAAPGLATAQSCPAPLESDLVIRDFQFASGETMAEVRL